MDQLSDFLKYVGVKRWSICPGMPHMVGLSGTVSELFAKMLLFHKTIICERSEDRKNEAFNEHCYIFICIGL